MLINPDFSENSIFLSHPLLQTWFPVNFPNLIEISPPRLLPPVLQNHLEKISFLQNILKDIFKSKPSMFLYWEQFVLFVRVFAVAF